MSKPTFAWSEPIDPPLQRTPLYQEHVGLSARLIPFAGWEMPVWYSSVGQEHRAVRQAAGLFDVAHMGTIGVGGPHAATFLDLVCTNLISTIKPGGSRYSTMLDIDGRILDDMWVYRLAEDDFLVVVNASNFAQDCAWLNAVNRGEVIIDREQPDRCVEQPACLRNLHDKTGGSEQRVDIALQGPASLSILLACAADTAQSQRLSQLKRTHITRATLSGIDLLIARTGYTGEKVGFELYVHPDQAASLWRLLLEQGRPLGLEPCGLAARDSLRTEAGLPLYGHELAGPLSISPTEAGFATYVKLDKPFFIGQTPYREAHHQLRRQIARFQVTDKGARAIRGGAHGEPVVNKRGRVVGTVTTGVSVGDGQVGMALMDARSVEVGSEVFIYPETRQAVARLPAEFRWGDTVAVPVRAVIIDRFPQV